jgi:hypothetical protein
LTKSYEPEILNAALEFATEWGDNFRQPIAARMLRRFTNLNGEEIAEIEKYVRSVEYRIYEIAEMEERSEI